MRDLSLTETKSVTGMGFVALAKVAGKATMHFLGSTEVQNAAESTAVDLLNDQTDCQQQLQQYIALYGPLPVHPATPTSSGT